MQKIAGNAHAEAVAALDKSLLQNYGEAPCRIVLDVAALHPAHLLAYGGDTTLQNIHTQVRDARGYWSMQDKIRAAAHDADAADAFAGRGTDGAAAARTWAEKARQRLADADGVLKPYEDVARARAVQELSPPEHSSPKAARAARLQPVSTIKGADAYTFRPVDTIRYGLHYVIPGDHPGGSGTLPGEYVTNGHFILRVDTLPTKYEAMARRTYKPFAAAAAADVQHAMPNLSRALATTAQAAHKLDVVGTDPENKGMTYLANPSDHGHLVGVDGRYLKTLLAATGADEIRVSDKSVGTSVHLYKNNEYRASLAPMRIGASGAVDVAMAKRAVASYTPPAPVKFPPRIPNAEALEATAATRVVRTNHRAAVVSVRHGSVVEYQLHARAVDGKWTHQKVLGNDQHRLLRYLDAYRDHDIVG